jgi:hypothetical protein
MTTAKPTLRAAILSHPDKDHVNLVGKLTDHFKPGELIVNCVIYGGDRDGYIKKDSGGEETDYLALLDAFKPGTDSVIKYPGNGASSITDPADPSTWNPIVDAGALKIYLLVGNVLYRAATFVP